MHEVNFYNSVTVATRLNICVILITFMSLACGEKHCNLYNLGSVSVKQSAVLTYVDLVLFTTGHMTQDEYTIDQSRGRTPE